MLLKKIIPQNNQFNLSDEELEIDISSIEIDSRKVVEGSVFFCFKGEKFNALDFIKSAKDNGAKVVVIDVVDKEKISGDNISDITLISSDSLHDLLIFMLSKFYCDLPKNIIAITGTNGKTSVAEFCRQILEILGKKAATIGTLGVNCSDLALKKEIVSSSLTTPDCVSLYKNLAIIKKHNIDYVAIEASSIGLEQGRMDGLKFDIAAFTNFSQDHLDYHENMQNYFAAKMILFKKMLKKGSDVVINSDIEEFSKIKEISVKNGLNVISYGYKKESDYFLKSSKQIDNLKEISLVYDEQDIKFNFSLLENFQEVNLVCAFGIISAILQLNREQKIALTKKLVDIKAVEGRMEKVANLANNARIYIDFAHTPDALENLLKLARNYTNSRILVLFGCGGNRDKAKRPIMGKIASKLADFVIVTDDNPRNEDPSVIRSQIIAAIEGEKFIEIANRKEAISKSISLLKSDDILIIAGKGHEKYQIIGDEYFEFDEKLIIEEFVSKK